MKIQNQIKKISSYGIQFVALSLLFGAVGYTAIRERFQLKQREQAMTTQVITPTSVDGALKLDAEPVTALYDVC